MKNFTCIVLGLSMMTCSLAEAEPALQVGSKKFTESVVLGEMLRQLAVHAGHPVQHRRELGGTRVLWGALLNGDIDAYPEYTGTLQGEILSKENIQDIEILRQALRKRGLMMSAPLGFDNTYAIGMTRKRAQQLGVRSIADLGKHPRLKLGFGNEFLNRADGWPGLQKVYQLPHDDVRGLDHDLAYRGIQSGTLDVMDLYATDAEIEYYDLVTLRDELKFFPSYNAVILYRQDLLQRAPGFVNEINRLKGAIDARTMRGLNAQAKLKGRAESVIAADFLRQELNIDGNVAMPTAWQRFWRHTMEHLILVALSLGAAIAVSVPLGILSALRPALGRWILGLTGIVQTLPSLALLVFMIPLLGIGGPPAIAALFLYSLLPIVRNTYAGLQDVPIDLRESAIVLGLPTSARLRLIELPLATRTILAGIKTAAVINVGTATLAALIGAGGYGQPILTGIRLDDIGLILQGAVPAAVLALLVQGGFEIIERWLLPRSMQVAPADS